MNISPNLEQMANHLEFLGYSVERTPAKADGEKSLILAKHSQNPNVVAIEMQPGWTLFRSSFGINKPVSQAMDIAISELSRTTDVANPHYAVEDGKVNLRFDSSYTGNYSKDVFGNFFTTFLNDIQKMYRLPNVIKEFQD